MTARRPGGIKLIVAYKLAKGVAEALLAAGLVALVFFGYEPRLLDAAETLRRHVVGAWSVRLADLLVAIASAHRLWELVVALVLDAALTVVEGMSLVKGYWWGPWLIVVATSTLLPFELVALARHPEGGRLVLLVINVAIVAYLVLRAARERRDKRDTRE